MRPSTMAFDAKGFFEGVRYVGRAKARRVTYLVYDSAKRYLLVWGSSRAAHSYYMTEVPRAYVEKVRGRSRARTTTSVEVRRRVGGAAFQPLAALVALAARGDAIVVPSKAGALGFRVRA